MSEEKKCALHVFVTGPNPKNVFEAFRSGKIGMGGALKRLVWRHAYLALENSKGKIKVFDFFPANKKFNKKTSECEVNRISSIPKVMKVYDGGIAEISSFKVTKSASFSISQGEYNKAIKSVKCLREQGYKYNFWTVGDTQNCCKTTRIISNAAGVKLRTKFFGAHLPQVMEFCMKLRMLSKNIKDYEDNKIVGKFNLNKKNISR
jgi:hypothetical protein